MATPTVHQVLLICGPLLWGGVDALRTRTHYGQHDAFFVARCEAHCWLTKDKNSCIKSCLSKSFTKPGECPKNDTVLTPFDAVCLNTCQKDSQCSALKKCCQHSCGVTCQYPIELPSATGIPNVPQDVRVSEGPKKKTILLEWKPNPSDINPDGTVMYVIEERHHTGHNFIEKHLSEWSFCARSVKLNHIVKNLVKPGRWYQFRVAAVNENGTKGFSENSPTFNIAIRPRPPKAPQNVTVSSLRSVSDGTLVGELKWLPPKSDLPIQKYKVFWSKRLHGAKPLDSVLVHQQVVPKDQNKFLLQGLQPNSLYFLQIQALVQYGRKRLKGQKSALVLNTTNYSNANYTTESTTSSERNKIEGVRVQKLYWSEESLRARIIWKPKKESLKYTVSLWTGPCYKNSMPSKYSKLAATTKVAHFDLYDLQFNCKYKVGVRNIDEDVKLMEDSYITFVTPNCIDFKRTNQKTRCVN